MAGIYIMAWKEIHDESIHRVVACAAGLFYLLPAHGVLCGFSVRLVLTTRTPASNGTDWKEASIESAVTGHQLRRVSQAVMPLVRRSINDLDVR